VTDDPATGVIPMEPRLRMPSLDLVVMDGPDRGVSHAVVGGRATIGTGSGCSLRLRDPTVSRVHCEIAIGRDRVRIVDRGSTNGTFVGSVRVRDAELTTSTDVRVGNTLARVAFGEAPTFVALSMKQRLRELVGASVGMRRIYAVIERAASSDATVLVQGETGTGKELVARTLHDLSPRAAANFVTVDCSSIAENLIESELFGHVRGAFSGAVSDRSGLLQQADRGTLFLDEIGELPLLLQPKLLRALEMREIRPIGSNTSRHIDVRVVAASNRPLAASVNEGSFREDLYYRLAVVEIDLPALRERREDIKALAEDFHERLTGEKIDLDPAVVTALMRRTWSGNVRELRNTVERSVLFGWPTDRPTPRVKAAPSTARTVEVEISPHLPLKEARAAWVEQFDSFYMKALLESTHGNVTRAAALAGLNRRSLQRLMIRLGLRSDDDEDG